MTEAAKIAASRYTSAAGLTLVAGMLCAGELAAHAISVATGGAVGHPVFGSLYNPVDGLRWLTTLDSRCAIGPYMAHLQHHVVRTVCHTHPSAIAAINESAAIGVGGGLAGMLGFRMAASRAKNPRNVGRKLRRVRPSAEHIVVRIGKSTGKLQESGARSGIKRGQQVCFVDNDLHLDTFIVGAKGAGKTTTGFNPILLQAMQQGCGGIVFNVKGNYHEDVIALARMAGCEDRVRVIGIGGEHCDILNGVTSEMAQTYVSAVLLLSDTGKDSMIWNTTASLLIRSILTLLWYFPTEYSLPNCYRYLYIKEHREAFDARVEQLEAMINADLATAQSLEVKALMQRDIDRIETGKREIVNYFDQTPDIQRGIKLQLQSILSNMIVPEMEDAFCNLHPQYGQSPLDLSDTYEHGTIFVINAPTQQYGVAAAAAAAWIKLRFQVAMDQRRILPNANKERRVFMAIDEFQEIVTASKEGLSDHKFLATSRDTRTFVIAATQSIHALDAKIGVEMRKALLPNFRQRLYFASEDIDTIKDALELLGQTEVKRETQSVTRGRNSSKGTSTQETWQPIAHADLFRNLDVNQALLIGTLDGKAADDVLQMTPVYV